MKILKRTKKIMMLATVPLTVVLLGMGLMGKVDLGQAFLYSILIDALCGIVMYRDSRLFLKH